QVWHVASSPFDRLQWTREHLHADVSVDASDDAVQNNPGALLVVDNEYLLCCDGGHCTSGPLISHVHDIWHESLLPRVYHRILFCRATKCPISFRSRGLIRR